MLDQRDTPSTRRQPARTLVLVPAQDDSPIAYLEADAPRIFATTEHNEPASPRAELAGAVFGVLLALALFIVVPGILIAHAVGFTPSVGQLLAAHPAGWMHRHFAASALRIAGVDLGSYVVVMVGVRGFNRARGR